MKNSTRSPKASSPQNTRPKRAENKDNLDSREGLEQLSKGEQVTHNKKDVQSQRKQVKKTGQ